ncbi:secondary thiamine-phosphate synthase enzyme YjbQ [Allohahella sp. A8]|uniref:secondary thiamine-phosphate synthase enzyme YjbQ n=1 Tax=Allohahella sp. A8 TaxID=3141461 RepID=UPI003A7FCB82
MWIQTELTLKPRQRGFHLITDEVENALSQLGKVTTGLLHVFIQHTSASLTLNENADPTVREDFERFFNQNVPDGSHLFRHTQEGPDDMPAHIKASLLGSSVSIPVCNGRLKMGTWQGIYLGEHRDDGGARRLILTLQGDCSD